jgi:nanoRNase/pAp phosphatase (c-di-AMP/oligoRNAs hydrolase)
MDSSVQLEPVRGRPVNKSRGQICGIPNPLKWDVGRSACRLDELAAVLEGAGRRRMLVLCHNNPDPDTIASAYGFQFLLSKKLGIRSIIGYGGVVTRAENRAMIQRLRIKMTQLSRIDHSRYWGIALIDAQPGTGNNLFDSRANPPLIVIDHHPLRKPSLKAQFHDIRPKYGATSTIITEYLSAAGLVPTRSLANALIYGIKADTNSLVRGASKIDFNAFNYLSPLTNPRVVAQIERPPLSSEYFEDYERGLARTTVHRDIAISCLGKIHSEAIIPELADVLLRLEGVSWSLCVGERNDLLILSMRSTSRLHKAGTVIRRLVGKAGSAGGHREMAGGQIPVAGMTEEEKGDLSRKLIRRFLKLLDRERVHPRALAEPPATTGEPID